MTTWSRQELLDLWERGARRHALDRALLLAASGRPRRSLEAVADLPLGVLRQSLLALRRANFGRALPALVDCPACGAALEVTLDADALRSEPPPEWIEVAGRRLRPPTSRDLAIAIQQPDRLSAQRCLAARCFVGDGVEPDDDVPADMVAAADDALARVDAAGDLVLDLSCDECGHAWEVPFDVGAHLWQEVDAGARQLLADVHVLASAYGWTEDDVLALSDERRAAYIALVTA